MTDVNLVLNAGSSSIKFSAFATQGGGGLELVLRGQVEGLFTAPRFKATDAQGTEVGAHAWGEGVALGHEGAIGHLAQFLRAHKEGYELTAVGHRVVHGGLAFSQATRITPAVIQALEKLIPLAPLHQPHNLKAIEIVAQQRPDLPQVACFDTAFHRALS